MPVPQYLVSPEQYEWNQRFRSRLPRNRTATGVEIAAHLTQVNPREDWFAEWREPERGPKSSKMSGVLLADGAMFTVAYRPSILFGHGRSVRHPLYEPTHVYTEAQIIDIVQAGVRSGQAPHGYDHWEM